MSKSKKSTRVIHLTQNCFLSSSVKTNHNCVVSSRKVELFSLEPFVLQKHKRNFSFLVLCLYPLGKYKQLFLTFVHFYTHTQQSLIALSIWIWAEKRHLQRIDHSSQEQYSLGSIVSDGKHKRMIHMELLGNLVTSILDEHSSSCCRLTAFFIHFNKSLVYHLQVKQITLKKTLFPRPYNTNHRNDWESIR